ncbi:hypothetical protein [Levilactobacillus suantsaii]|uniref:Uncharacterized protein n=1 Tax=Levilactobacillus suantsaii TaxID=2292255 RepID=A0A4Q0VGG1_9LACO|nr:hypothetical protein [Levilactobacillus suantsaii]QMU07279.1 hypothetical protein H3M12_07205 [Levilactobacillus suantsaii]RXI77923.1 hypothetical protein DXH47_08420 [Levilactobacillus suantsaii]
MNRVAKSLMLTAAMLGVGVTLGITKASASEWVYNGHDYGTYAKMVAATNADAKKKQGAKNWAANIKDQETGLSKKAKKELEASYSTDPSKIKNYYDGTTSKKTTKSKKAAKKYAYKVTNLKATKTKSGKYIKVTGKIKVSTKSLANKHHAKWARIHLYKGADKYARLTKKMTFSKAIKRYNAKHVYVKAAYKTKNQKKSTNKQAVYTNHMLSKNYAKAIGAYKK